MRQKPVQIEDGEWWYKGCIIQNNKKLLGFQHPRLMAYGVFWNTIGMNTPDNPGPYACHTKAEAIAWCNAHPCANPVHQAEDFLK